MYESTDGAPDTAHEQFKRHSTRTYRISATVAVMVHIAAFVFIPAIEIEAYKLPEPEFVLVDDLDYDEPPDVDERVDEAMPPKPATRAIPDPDEVVEPEVPEPPDIAPAPEEAPTPAPRDGRAPPYHVFDALPVLIERVAPAYPPLAREGGIEGTVHVRVLVDEAGRVADAVVLNSDVTPAMERCALDAARACRFQPARQGSRTVRAWVAIPFSFILRR
jgi:protein TonB